MQLNDFIALVGYLNAGIKDKPFDKRLFKIANEKLYQVFEGRERLDRVLPTIARMPTTEFVWIPDILSCVDSQEQNDVWLCRTQTSTLLKRTGNIAVAHAAFRNSQFSLAGKLDDASLHFEHTCNYVSILDHTLTLELEDYNWRPYYASQWQHRSSTCFVTGY